MTIKDVYDDLEALVSEEIPGFSVDYKDTTKDWKLRFAAVVVGLFNERFMTGYTTTLFPKVYFVSEEKMRRNYVGSFRTLAHEYVHLYDQKQHPLWFPLSYLFPQVLAVFSLLALGAIWYFPLIWCLLFLVFLAPLPAPWRSKWEIRGYLMNLLIESRVNDGRVPVRLKNLLSDVFTGWGYYKMWPFSGIVSREIDKFVEQVEGRVALSNMDDTEPYDKVLALMDRRGL